MSVKYGRFEMPEEIKLDETSQTPVFGRFVVEPFERGFGHTVGNALRRIMLTALEAPAVVSVRIEGVPHEYMSVDGIVQDMTHIVLSLKGSLLRYLSVNEGEHPREIESISLNLDITDEMIENGNGEHHVLLKDFFKDTNYELVNPDLHIFTVTKPMTRRVDLRIASGRGYVPSNHLWC